MGLGIRLYDITDPPLDFHPTRQLRSALIARGMYYQNLEGEPEWKREQAMQAWQRESIIEPPVMERLSAWLYGVFGGMYLWIPRSLSSLFWVSAAVAIFLLGSELSRRDGGLAAAFYFLFLPYGIYASRTFQPDPLMIALIAWALWAFLHWYRVRTMRMALYAGLLSGLAIFVKSVAVFFIGGAFAGLILLGVGALNALRERQIWVMAGLAATPATAFTIYGLWVAGFLQRQFNYRFFPQLWRDQVFYIRWQEMATNIAGFAILLAALTGILLVRDKGKRGFLLGLWVGYGLYSFVFPYHTITHDYYQLPLILIVSVSSTVVFAELLGSIAAAQKGTWVQMSVVLLLFAAAAFKVWDVRVNLARDNYRGELDFWEQVGQNVEPGASVLSMSQEYGYPLAYYGWRTSDVWLNSQDIELRVLAGKSREEIVEKQYDALTEHDYFVITKMSKLNGDPSLKEMLYNQYSVVAEGRNFVIFDLSKK